MDHEMDVNPDPELEVTVETPVAEGEQEQEATSTTHSEAEGATEELGSEEDAPAEETPAEEHKRKTGSSRERERRRALEAQLAQKEAELQALRAGNTAPAAATAAPAANGEPTLAQFDTVEQFLDARDRYRDTQVKERELAQAWEAREKEVRAKHEDYDDSVEDFVAMRPPVSLVNSIMESPVGPELVRFFGTNPEEVKRISQLSPTRQAMELGKIEAKMTETKKPVQKSKAPAPITPVKPSAAITPPKEKSLYIEY